MSTPPAAPRLVEDGHGIIRDEQGIVVGRRRRHPLADLFKDVPMGGTAPNMPGMGILPEMQHLLAIHTFDNLRCSPPKDPRYVHKTPKNVPRGTHRGAPGLWVPIALANDPAFEETEDTVTIPDPAGWSPQKIAAMETALAAEKIEQTLVEQADAHITTPEQAGKR